MLPDVKNKPSKTRLREIVMLLGVPQKQDNANLSMDLLFQKVQDEFLKCV